MHSCYFKFWYLRSPFVIFRTSHNEVQTKWNELYLFCIPTAVCNGNKVIAVFTSSIHMLSSPVTNGVYVFLDGFIYLSRQRTHWYVTLKSNPTKSWTMNTCRIWAYKLTSYSRLSKKRRNLKLKRSQFKTTILHLEKYHINLISIRGDRPYTVLMG